MPTYFLRPGASAEDLHGPYSGPVAFGSDATQCQMVVTGSAAVRPVHATLGPHVRGQYTLAPAGPDCRVYVRSPGSDTVWAVESPVSAKVGATIIFGSPEGPAYLIRHGNASADPPLGPHDENAMMGALDRALGTQVRALDDEEAPPRAPDAPPDAAVDDAPAEPELPTEVLARMPTQRRLTGAASPMMGCVVAALSGMVFGGLAFGAGTLAVVQLLSGHG